MNAVNGAARVLERPQEFGWRACVAEPSASPLTCSDAGSEVIWYHTYNNPNGPQLSQCPHRDPGNPNGKCRSGPALRANHALNEANVVLHTVQQTDATICCDRLGGSDHILDVVIKTSATTSVAAYEPVSESILSNPTSNYLSNFDVVWHELGHHILYKNATAYGFPTAYGASGEFFTTAFVEAFADLMTAAISMNARDTTKNVLQSGEPWSLADGGAPPPDGHRNLADQGITSFYHLSSSNDPHEAGRAISKYFYNVFTTSGMTGPRFAELLLQVSRQIRDVDQNRLDLGDVKAALLASARSGETALVNAINARFSEMYNNIPGVNDGHPPIGVPVSSNAPPPPYPVTVLFEGNCPIVNGVRTTEWRVQWSPSPFAVSYRVFGQQVNGPLSDLATTSGTFIFAHTNVTAQISVSACGANGACGGSSARVLVNMRSECNF